MPEAFPLASGLVFPGWVGLVASAGIAVAAMKIYAKVPSLPVIKSMAAMLNIPSLTHVIVYVFGAEAHILAQILRYEGKKLFAFTRAGDIASQDFAGRMGAVWAGGGGY